PNPGRWHGGGGGGGWNAGGAFVGGTILGLALGATLSSPPPPPPPTYVYVDPPPPAVVVYPRYANASDAHIPWCTAHYATYNGETDTYFGYDGLTYRCVAPY